jgi:hypothetical protein
MGGLVVVKNTGVEELRPITENSYSRLFSPNVYAMSCDEELSGIGKEVSSRAQRRSLLALDELYSESLRNFAINATHVIFI